ncbi:MAG: PIN domain-containing protein [Nanoarchaeota archaeon]
MDDELIFFDSYALVELYEGNINYAKFENMKAITSYLNAYETYYILRKKYPERDLDEYFQVLKKICTKLKFEWIKEAVEFRLNNKKKKLSYADCIGYTIAQELGIKFLTGDNQFKNLKNVEFVK